MSVEAPTVDEYLDEQDYEGERSAPAPEGTDTDYNEDGIQQGTSGIDVQPTLLGDDYSEGQKADDRDLRATLSEGEAVVTGTGMGLGGEGSGGTFADEAEEAMPDSQETVDVDEASQGYSPNPSGGSNSDPMPDMTLPRIGPAVVAVFAGVLAMIVAAIAGDPA